MKKFWKYLMAGAVIASLAPLSACSDDDATDPYDINYVYLRQPTDTYASVEYKANGDIMSGFTDPYTLVPVRLTKPAPQDLTVEVVVDPSLVDEYNEATGKDYVFINGLDVLNSKLTIKKGEYLSTEPIQITMTDPKAFAVDATDLILPIVIKSNNAGLTTSKSSRIFLTFTSDYVPNLYNLAVSTINKKAITVVDGWQNSLKSINVVDFLTLSYAPYEDVTVNVAIDNSKVADYNTANGTNYVAMTDASLAASTITITPEQTGASLTVNTGDISALANGTTYVIPVNVTSVSGAAVEPTENTKSTFYIVLSGAGYELEQVSNVNGYVYNYTSALTCTVDGQTTTGSYTWADVLKPDDYAWAYWTPTQPMEIDLGETINLTGLCLNCYGAYRCPVTFELETSADGQTWTKWDVLNVTQKSYLYATLSVPSQTRYIKMKGTMPTNSYYQQVDVEWLKLYYE